MLKQILRQVRDFKRRHGLGPSVVFVNQSHYAVLRQKYPAFFDENPSVRFGFQVLVVPNEVIAYPELVWLPPKASREPIEASISSASRPILEAVLPQIHAIH